MPPSRHSKHKGNRASSGDPDHITDSEVEAAVTHCGRSTQVNKRAASPEISYSDSDAHDMAHKGPRSSSPTTSMPKRDTLSQLSRGNKVFDNATDSSVEDPEEDDVELSVIAKKRKINRDGTRDTTSNVNVDENHKTQKPRKVHKPAHDPTVPATSSSLGLSKKNHQNLGNIRPSQPMHSIDQDDLSDTVGPESSDESRERRINQPDLEYDDDNSSDWLPSAHNSGSADIGTGTHGRGTPGDSHRDTSRTREDVELGSAEGGSTQSNSQDSQSKANGTRTRKAPTPKGFGKLAQLMGCYGSPSKCGRLRDSIRLAALPYHLDYAYSSFDPEWMGQFLVDISLKYDWDREDTKLILIIICEDGARNKVRKAAREATNFPTRRRGRPPKTQSQGSNQVENDYRNVLHQHTKNSKSTPGKPERSEKASKNPQTPCPTPHATPHSTPHSTNHTRKNPESAQMLPIKAQGGANLSNSQTALMPSSSLGLSRNIRAPPDQEPDLFYYVTYSPQKAPFRVPFDLPYIPFVNTIRKYVHLSDDDWVYYSIEFNGHKEHLDVLIHPDQRKTYNVFILNAHDIVHKCQGTPHASYKIYLCGSEEGMQKPNAFAAPSAAPQNQRPATKLPTPPYTTSIAAAPANGSGTYSLPKAATPKDKAQTSASAAPTPQKVNTKALVKATPATSLTSPISAFKLKQSLSLNKRTQETDAAEGEETSDNQGDETPRLTGAAHPLHISPPVRISTRSKPASSKKAHNEVTDQILFNTKENKTQFRKGKQDQQQAMMESREATGRVVHPKRQKPDCQISGGKNAPIKPSRKKAPSQQEIIHSDWSDTIGVKSG